MTTPFVCLAVATLLAYLPKVQTTGMSAERRALLDRLARDGFEALTAFAIAVFVVHFAGADAHRVRILSIAFVVTRGLYLASHLADLEYLRGALWGLGVALTAGLFALPLLS
jgi:uncharacterized MAPEG superfamily protein